MIPTRSLALASLIFTSLIATVLLAATPGLAQSPAFPVDLASGIENGDAFLAEPPRFEPPTAPLFQAVEFEGRLYFAAAHPHYGVELFVSDGTAVGTALAYDVCPGPCNSWPGSLTVFGDALYFAADDGQSGREIHVLRPGAEPMLLADLCFGPCSSAPSPFEVDVSPAVGDGTLYFVADDGESGREIWLTDGRPAGTRRAADLCLGRCSMAPKNLVARGSLLFFEVETPAPVTRSIARSDGTPEGTFLLRHGRDPRPLGEGIVMISFTEGFGEELWKSDGTLEGTVPVDGDCPGGCRLARDFFGALDGRVFFLSQLRYLLSTDGTRTGTEIAVVRRVLDHAGFAALGNELFFFTRNDFADPADLWAATGLPGQSRTVFDNVPPPIAMAAAGQHLFFLTLPAEDVWELWSSDGTESGTAPLRRFAAPVAGYAALDGRLVMTAAEGPEGRELWASDGSTGGTALVADIHRGAASSRPRDLRTSGDLLAFSAAGPRPGVHLADGARGRLFAPVEGLNEPPEIYADADGFLFCFGRARGVPPESPGLWRLGAGGAARQLLPDVYDCEGLTPFAGGLLMAADSSSQPFGQELWFTDLTAAGTRLVADIAPASGLGIPIERSSNPAGLTVLGGAVIFAAQRDAFNEVDVEEGRELWRSDGTSEGTRLLADLWLEGSSDPAGLTRLGDRVVFAATDGRRGRELFATDGTAAGTGRVLDLQPGLASSDPHGFVELDGALYFFARRGGSDRLWRTDGTRGGTRHVVNLAFGGRPSSAGEMVRLGDRLVFTLYNPRTGAELWVSDGTARGTRQILEIAPHRRDAAPVELTVVELTGDEPLGGTERVVFAADDGRHGREPWMSDGSAMGTRMLADVAPGPASSAPSDFAAVGRFLAFSATTSERGTELWALPLAALAQPSGAGPGASQATKRAGARTP